MTAKRKLLLVAIAAAVVLAGGAFAWKNGKGSGNAAAVATATKPGERPIELIAAELAHHQAARPGRRRALHRHHPAGRPDDREGARRRPPCRGAGARRRSRHQGPAAGALRDQRAAVAGSTSASPHSTPPAPTRAGRRATSATRKRSPSATSSRSRPLDAARADAENKASMVSVAEAQLEIAQRNLGDAEVRAPFDGVVGERIANQGESLPIDGKILALLDTSHVEVAAQMPAADVVRLKVDQAATRDPGRLRRARVPGPHHPHQSDGAGRARARSRSMSRSATATTRCAAACSPWARSIVAEKGHALAVPAAAMRKDDAGRLCARRRERRAGHASRSAPCAPGRAASSSR